MPTDDKNITKPISDTIKCLLLYLLEFNLNDYIALLNVFVTPRFCCNYHK